MVVTSEWVHYALLLWLSPSGATVSPGADRRTDVGEGGRRTLCARRR
jgi:hypothetical protein